MKVHPRYRIRTAAKIELEEAFWKICQQHDLTTAEAISILTEVSHVVAMQAVKDERETDGLP